MIKKGNQKKSPVRIAQIIGKLSAGGVEAVLYSYYRFIDKSKFQFDFFYDADSAVAPPPELTGMGARFYRIPPYQQLPAYIKALEGYFRANQYAIVHSNMNTLAVFSLFAAWRAGVPVRIVHNHSTAGKGETKKNVLKYILRPFAGVFATERCACSRYAGAWMFGKKAVESGKVTIFNNAIDCAKYRYNERLRQDVRHELGVEGRFVVGHVGRFCIAKNHEFLHELFVQVAGLPCVFSREVPDEAAITENVRYLALDAPVSVWAKAVLASRDFVRKDTLEAIRKAGFDIEKEAGRLEGYYEERIKKVTEKK